MARQGYDPLGISDALYVCDRQANAYVALDGALISAFEPQHCASLRKQWVKRRARGPAHII